MARLMLNETHWSRLKAIMKQFGIYNKRGLRLTVEGMLYRMRVGCPWRDLPGIFGNWNSIYKTFNRWSLQDKLMRIFKHLVIDPDLEWEFIDASIVKAHQHNAGISPKTEQAIGISRGGNTTKIHMAADSYGLPIHFSITGGEVHDAKRAVKIISEIPDADLLLVIEVMIVQKFEKSLKIKELLQ